MATLVKHKAITHKVAFGLVALSALLLISGNAQAKITKLLKKRKIVVINDKRVKKGDQVCFYKKKSKRACGRVVKVSKSKKKSYVRIAKRSSFRKLEKGMAHEVVGASSSIAKKSSGGSRFKLRPSFQPSFNRRAKYFLPNLNDDETTPKFERAGDPAKPEGIFNKLSNEVAKHAWGGVGLELDALIYQSISVAFGTRYVYLATASASSTPGTTLDKDNDDTATSVKASEHELSAWLDVYPYEIPTALIRLGIGVEGNYNMLSVVGGLIDCKNNACAGALPKLKSELYTLTANLVTISFRVTARRDMQITENFGVGAALRGIITPLKATGSTTLTGSVNKDLIALFTDKEALQKALKESLAYDKPEHFYSVMLELSAFFLF